MRRNCLPVSDLEAEPRLRDSAAVVPLSRIVFVCWASVITVVFGERLLSTKMAWRTRSASSTDLAYTNASQVHHSHLVHPEPEPVPPAAAGAVGRGGPRRGRPVFQWLVSGRNFAKYSEEGANPVAILKAACLEVCQVWSMATYTF